MFNHPMLSGGEAFALASGFAALFAIGAALVIRFLFAPLVDRRRP